MTLLLVAHGSPDPRHAACVREIAQGVARRGRACEAVFLEHDRPRALDRVRATEEPVELLPLLLSGGYHTEVDIPRLVVESAAPATALAPVGVGPWLEPALDAQVRDAGGTPTTPVVITWAGSQRREAQERMNRFGRTWAAGRPGPVDVTAEPDRLIALAADHPDSVVVRLFVAPGVLADRVADAADRAGLRCSSVLGASETMIDVVLARSGTAADSVRAG